jgi:ribose transport system permease protein
VSETMSEASPAERRPKKRARRTNHLRVLRFGNIGAVYVWIAIIVVFSLLKPHEFPRWATVQIVLNVSAISGLVALSLIVPLCMQVFDLSVGYVVALATALCAELIVVHHYSYTAAILACLAAALAAGMLNGLLVVVAGISSFIATLATGSVVLAVVELISNNVIVTSTQLSTDFSKLANTSIVGGIDIPVFIMFGVAIVLWWLLEQTVTGRRMYAVGFNEDSARLTGIKGSRLRFVALLTSALVAGLAGVLLTSFYGSSAPTVGPNYLLSSFTAAFLGATQFRNGRFNAQGTLIAVLMLATGTAGLGLVGAQPWASDMFTGVVLVASLALYRFEQRRTGTGPEPAE